MLKKREVPQDLEARVLIGKWIAGDELQHLQQIKAIDFADKNVEYIVGKIQSVYYSGITKGMLITQQQKIKLVDELVALGFDKTEIFKLAEEAKDMDIAYRQAVSRMYDTKSRILLSGIDYTKPGAQEQAQEILTSYKVDGSKALKQPSYDAVKRLRHMLEHPEEQKIISAGTPLLTEYSGGLRLQDLTVISARPAGGKSAFGLQLAMQAEKDGFKAMFVTLEMSDLAVTMRMVSAREWSGRITSDMLRGLTPIPEESRLQLDKAMDEVERIQTGGNFIMLEGECDLAEIERQVEIYNPDVLVIDQLTQLEDSREKFKSDQLRIKYSHMTSHLKRLAMKTNTSIVLLAQLNRAAEDKMKNGAKPSNTFFKESGSIEEDADRCFILSPQENDDVKKGKQVDIWCTKNRDYKSDFVVHTLFHEHKMQFIETEDN